ncbi:hypothetical protein O6H91_23G044800 [Diphasiastrum complanatum]|uniref:Uncharacterized protein n=1 Tax=Diphasiastrum complanatum TaxID=34168 RepID=A0ACC2AA52_DIPCM|nr:hypothetical protein O6H91_23G044800 [Diphasiastrum complanatum]
MMLFGGRLFKPSQTSSGFQLLPRGTTLVSYSLSEPTVGKRPSTKADNRGVFLPCEFQQLIFQWMFRSRSPAHHHILPMAVANIFYSSLVSHQRIYLALIKQHLGSIPGRLL